MKLCVIPSILKESSLGDFCNFFNNNYFINGGNTPFYTTMYDILNVSELVEKVVLDLDVDFLFVLVLFCVNVKKKCIKKYFCDSNAITGSIAT